jgi:aminopeptidase N
MAHAVDDFLSNNKDYQMVVLAGGGHIMYGSGIPERVNRLNGKDYSILISSNVGVMEDTVADYVLFPDPLDPPSSPKLGIFIKNVQNGVQIDDFSPESIALETGLEKEDIIVFIDSLKIETIDDLKIALFDRRAGESLEIKVLRNKFFMGKKEVFFSITLP